MRLGEPSDVLFRSMETSAIYNDHSSPPPLGIRGANSTLVAFGTISDVHPCGASSDPTGTFCATPTNSSPLSTLFLLSFSFRTPESDKVDKHYRKLQLGLTSRTQFCKCPHSWLSPTVRHLSGYLHANGAPDENNDVIRFSLSVVNVSSLDPLVSALSVKAVLYNWVTMRSPERDM